MILSLRKFTQGFYNTIKIHVNIKNQSRSDFNRLASTPAGILHALLLANSVSPFARPSQDAGLATSGLAACHTTLLP